MEQPTVYLQLFGAALAALAQCPAREARAQETTAASSNNPTTDKVDAQSSRKDFEQRPDAPEAYFASAEAALVEYQNRNYTEALKHFLEAHAIFPNARSHRSLGKVEFNLGHYVESVRHLEGALESGVRPLNAELRLDVESLLVRAREYIGRYTIRTMPPDAKLAIDARAVLDADGTVLLSAGDHVLTAGAEGYVPGRMVLQVVGGEKEDVVLQLLPLNPSSKADEASNSKRAPNWWLVGGVGIAAVAAVTIVAILVSSGTRTTRSDSEGAESGIVIPVPAD